MTAAAYIPPARRANLRDTCRLIPSIYPTRGLFDKVASADDLARIFELESWTNDRISAELGILHRLPRAEWVSGRPGATVIMAAFCHPKPDGGRFNGPDLGAWYAGLDLETAHAEVIYHRSRELAELGLTDVSLQMRLYLADFHAVFHDVRAKRRENEPLHDAASYTESQALARRLLEDGSNGVIYRSVRRQGGHCVACFRPALVEHVRADRHFEYRWEGAQPTAIRPLK